MESELVRQATILFGESMTRRLEERPPDSGSGQTDAAADAQAGPPLSGSIPAGDAAAESVPPLVKLNMTARQQSRLWRHVESIDNFWERLAPLEPGIIERLAAVAMERRWEVIFLTKLPRTAGFTAQRQSQRWLEAHGFALPSVFVVQGSRWRIAASLALDIVVDDRPENCLDVVVDSKARAILVWRDDPKLLPAAAKRLGIGVVNSVAECLDILTQVDLPGDREQPGMMNRVMRLLGLKEPASA